MGIMRRHLNLLPWNLRCRLLLRQRLRQWAIGWALLALGVAMLFGWKWHGLSAAQENLSVWQRRAATIQVIDVKNEKLRRQIAGLTARLSKYGHLESEQIGFQLLATISQSSSLGAGNIQVRKLTFNHTQVAEAVVVKDAAPGAAKTAPVMREVRKLILSGVAVNNLAVAQFVSSLRDSGAFQAVDLKSSQGNKVADTGARTYQVECSF